MRNITYYLKIARLFSGGIYIKDILNIRGETTSNTDKHFH
ncbi:Uncharacterised protein [Mammaliicoccus stepanovicii]|uniref:Uncharacterized protein n=1 Tax=Mammaliicoccus stepanovicii TaxID=643214 RepID=A0A239ZVQ7_9STAP|nr:Uncharacterised protein [Mammaliicoccus stepanovicii]